MFDWKVDEDRKRIQNGPFEFRILEKPVEDPYECLSPDWRIFFEELRGLPAKYKRKNPYASDGDGMDIDDELSNNNNNNTANNSNGRNCSLM